MAEAEEMAGRSGVGILQDIMGSETRSFKEKAVRNQKTAFAKPVYATHVSLPSS